MQRSLILGGTKGLGRAIAIDALARRITPVIVGRTADASASDPELAGAEFFAQDITRIEYPFKAEIARPEGYDYVIWTAGIFMRKTLYETSFDDVRAMVDTHVAGPITSLAMIHRLQCASRPLGDPPGRPYHLVTVASTSSWRMRENEAVYCAVKAAKAHFTRNFARELVKTLPGSKATLVNPGGMATPNFWAGSGQNMAGFMDPAVVARIIWDEVAGQTEPFKELQIIRGDGGSPRVEYGARMPESPF
jgi:NAD(P)-dependent dehydrogenase (short-subunit alcohol dehydrogenase family)